MPTGMPEHCNSQRPVVHSLPSYGHSLGTYQCIPKAVECHTVAGQAFPRTIYPMAERDQAMIHLLHVSGKPLGQL